MRYTETERKIYSGHDADRQKPFVLLVDDEPQVRKALIRELERDFDLLEAGTCEEAKAILEKNQNIRAVVSDCHMGRGESGIDLLRHVGRARPDLGRIVVSGTLELGEGSELVNDGVAHVFLQKPWKRRDLLRIGSLELFLAKKVR